ncbi:NADH-quinone oxidoreductase subunit 5 family protein [Streptomyces tirandamycinicus]|uniref:NADH-quinone oxidoreductase subunit 5 family protein n=1 Tax=Streptomyces tirandamycinicus TaxID=2174846 RepID=UPI00226F6046|nr:proton-conducting transporter membrane subunit [Streptomyces tirandamycinicus]MCY0980534.1 proton-conducting transporter membrane subunit [Streptomyces tirandamycinicus]
MSWVLWALVGLPLVSGVLLCLGGRRADRVAPAAAVFVAAAGIVLAVTAAYAQPRAGAPLLQGAAFGLAVDGLSGLMVVTVTAVAALILLFSTADVGPDQARARFFGVMLLFVGAMLVTVTATTLPSLLMSWEVMGATSWALIGYWWHDPVRGRAAGVAFITTRTADLGLYLAAGAALAGGQSLALAGLDQVARPWLHLVAAGVIAAALGKSAQLPFSFWLSRAMQGPSPVSALLHSATMVVAGAYLLIRTGPLLSASGWGSDVTAWIGVTTAFALGLVAVAQTDLKQLLAASSCAQIGFMVLAAGTGSAVGGTLQLIAHAAAKSLAFLVTGFWLTRLGTKDLSKLRGAARAAPVAGVAFSVAALSLAGVPPLSLWAAKDVLLAGALAHSPALYAAGLAAAAVSAMYSVRALWYVWRPAPPPRPAPGGPAPGRVSAAEGVPFAVLSGAAVVLTVLVLPPVREALARTLGVNGEAQPLPWEFAVSGLLALSVAAAVWAWGERPGPVARPAVRWAAGWLGLEAASRFVLVRPVQRLAEELAGFDDRVLDRGVDGLARGTLRLADVVNRRVETAVDGLVEGTAAASRALGRLARRPQTGQLHQYLAQAVAAFTVLAVVLVLVR